MELRWSLDALYTGFDTPKFTKDMEQFKKDLSALCIWADENLNDTENAPDKMDQFIKMQNALGAYDNLSSYCHLILSVDSSNSEALKNLNMIEDMATDLAKPIAKFKTFLKNIEHINEIVLKNECLKEHEFYLNEVKEESNYMLSEEEEVLFSKMKTTGSGAFTKLFEQMTSTLLVDVTGEIDLDKTGKLPLPMVRNLAYDKDPAIRKMAYEAELNAYDKVDKPVAAALNAIKGEAINTAKMRGYASVLDMTIKNARMEQSALDALFDAVEQSLPKFRQYYRHKAKLLGDLNGLKYYNLYAPMGQDIRFSYDEAADYIIKNFTAFSEEMGAFAKQAFDNAWLDVEPRAGKVGGAFCHNLHPIKESRIMSNFSGTFDSMMTLAHELGHGYHGHCLKNATYLNSHYSMPIAETASTFCETLVYKAAAKNAGKIEKLLILENSISSAGMTVVDIYSRFLFEDELIRRRENGPLSVEELNEIMVNAIKKSYGDGLDQTTLHPYMWLCKPHYYEVDTNYYNFPYVYGQLFSTGLYSLYLEQGDSFINRYNQLLEATGKNSLKDIGLMCGIDVFDKNFWAKSLRVIEEDIDEFMKLELE